MTGKSISREAFEAYLDENDIVEEYSKTAHGYMVHQNGTRGRTATTYGRMVETRGWVVDIVGADREWVHFVPLDSLLDDDGGDEDDA